MKKSKYIKIKLIVVIIVFALIGMSLVNNNREKEKVFKVAVESVETTDSIEAITEVTGTLKIRNQNMKDVALESSARVNMIMVENGQSVSKDDELIRLEKLSDHTEIIIKADESGTIMYQKEIHVGSILAQYATIITIYNLESTDDFYIEAKIPTSEYENMAYVQRVEATFGNNVKNMTLNGTVSDVKPQIVSENDSQYYVLNILITDEENALQQYDLANKMQIPLLISSTMQLSEEEETEDLYFVIY